MELCVCVCVCCVSGHLIFPLVVQLPDRSLPLTSAVLLFFSCLPSATASIQILLHYSSSIRQWDSAEDIREQWASCLVRWLEHMRRHPLSPASMLEREQGETWLVASRAQRTGGALRARGTGTRGGGGKPHRWGENWVDQLKDKLGIENPDREKRLSWQRACFVESFLKLGNARF